MSTGAVSPVRSTTEVSKTIAVFDVGDTGAHTVKYGKGIASIARGDTGKFTITFTEVWPILLDVQVRYATATTVENYNTHMVVDTFNRAAKTVAFEVNDIDETAALIDPASGSDCYVEATWLKTL